MKQSEYLYGAHFAPQKLKDMTYETALEYKVECAKKLIHHLSDERTIKTEWTRIAYVYKAIDFNLKLLNEIKGKGSDVEENQILVY